MPYLTTIALGHCTVSSMEETFKICCMNCPKKLNRISISFCFSSLLALTLPNLFSAQQHSDINWDMALSFLFKVHRDPGETEQAGIGRYTIMARPCQKLAVGRQRNPLEGMLPLLDISLEFKGRSRASFWRSGGGGGGQKPSGITSFAFFPSGAKWSFLSDSYFLLRGSVFPCSLCTQIPHSYKVYMFPAHGTR